MSLENGEISKETFKLLKYTFIEQQNILALYIIGNYEYEKTSSEAYKMFQVLNRLLNEGTQEYK